MTKKKKERGEIFNTKKKERVEIDVVDLLVTTPKNVKWLPNISTLFFLTKKKKNYQFHLFTVRGNSK